MPNFIRIILGALILGAAITLIVFSYWGWGILLIFISILVFITYIFNEKMLLAQWFLRKENMEKAESWLNSIKDYEKELFKGQWGYYHLLLGLIESRKSPMKSEKFFKKALSFGLTMDHNIALANLSLAGVEMGKRNKREAQRLLKEAEKADKNKLLAEQIKMMKGQMSMLDKTQMVRGGRGGSGFRQF
jgi:Na+-transporting methylmalonyl-CoA/oxaloacetate decarboxylase gamma subunit